MIEYLVAGGPVMVPIGICSVAALAIFFERMWSLRRQRVVPSGLYAQVRNLLEQGRFDDALVACRTRDTALARVLEAAILERGHPRAHIKERVEEVGRREAAEMERGIPALGTIASVGPLLGLLGTVGGMIMTFESIQTAGLGNVTHLAGGISQALITTFAGLVVGIPALVGNRYLLARVDRSLISLEEASLGMLEVLTDAEGRATLRAVEEAP